MKGITEPRLYTHELRPLTEETTLGFACIEYAKTVLRKTLYPWQEWALIHALEIVGDLSGEWHFRYRAVLFLISRENGPFGGYRLFLSERPFGQYHFRDVPFA